MVAQSSSNNLAYRDVDDLIPWFKDMVDRLDVDGSYNRTIVLHIPTAKRLIQAIERLRYSPLGDNHHNAMACPYCNPSPTVETEKVDG